MTRLIFRISTNPHRNVPRLCLLILTWCTSLLKWSTLQTYLDKETAPLFVVSPCCSASDIPSFNSERMLSKSRIVLSMEIVKLHIFMQSSSRVVCLVSTKVLPSISSDLNSAIRNGARFPPYHLTSAKLFRKISSCNRSWGMLKALNFCHKDTTSFLLMSLIS